MRRVTITVFTHVLLLLIVACVCGSLGQAITGTSRGGCLVSIAVGFIGALLGSWISGGLGLPDLLVLTIGSMQFPVLWSIIGSALFVGGVGFFTKPRIVVRR